MFSSFFFFLSVFNLLGAFKSFHLNKCKNLRVPTIQVIIILSISFIYLFFSSCLVWQPEINNQLNKRLIMERYKIPMLSRFDTISHIMSYYAQTHRAFLLLSGLCLETRDKLDEFYDEFIASMKKCWEHIGVDSTNKLTHLFLPNELFEISIECRNQKV